MWSLTWRCVCCKAVVSFARVFILMNGRLGGMAAEDDARIQRAEPTNKWVSKVWRPNRMRATSERKVRANSERKESERKVRAKVRAKREATIALSLAFYLSMPLNLANFAA